MNRICFTLLVKPASIAEYKEHHREVWPEMRAALTRCGWHNYSLFLRSDGLLVGYFETPGTLDDALAAMANESINQAWQTFMAPYFEGHGGPADQIMTELESVFHLP